MPAPNPQEPDGLVEYLIHGTKHSRKRVEVIEGDNHYGPWIDPELLNGFAAVDPPLKTVQYRYNYKSGSLNFRGHINAENGYPATVAFYIDEVYWPSHDKSYLTDIQTDLLGNFNSCRVMISSVDGSIILRWPAT